MCSKVLGSVVDSSSGWPPYYCRAHYFYPLDLSCKKNKDRKLVICAVASFQLQVVHGNLNLCVPPVLLVLINYAAMFIASKVVHGGSFSLKQMRIVQFISTFNIVFDFLKNQENLRRIKFPRFIRGSFADCIQQCIVSGMQEENC